MEIINKDSLLHGIKYLYLLFFFSFLSGIFGSVITGREANQPFTGMLILFVGLLGMLLLYRGIKDDINRKKYWIAGVIIITGDLFFMLAASGTFG